MYKDLLISAFNLATGTTKNIPLELLLNKGESKCGKSLPDCKKKPCILAADKSSLQNAVLTLLPGVSNLTVPEKDASIDIVLPVDIAATPCGFISTGIQMFSQQFFLTNKTGRRISYSIMRIEDGETTLYSGEIDTDNVILSVIDYPVSGVLFDLKFANINPVIGAHPPGRDILVLNGTMTIMPTSLPSLPETNSIVVGSNVFLLTDLYTNRGVLLDNRNSPGLTEVSLMPSLIDDLGYRISLSVLPYAGSTISVSNATGVLLRYSLSVVTDTTTTQYEGTSMGGIIPGLSPPDSIAALQAELYVDGTYQDGLLTGLLLTGIVTWNPTITVPPPLVSNNLILGASDNNTTKQTSGASTITLDRTIVNGRGKVCVGIYTSGSVTITDAIGYPLYVKILTTDGSEVVTMIDEYIDYQGSLEILNGTGTLSLTVIACGVTGAMIFGTYIPSTVPTVVPETYSTNLSLTQDTSIIDGVLTPCTIRLSSENLLISSCTWYSPIDFVITGGPRGPVLDICRLYNRGKSESITITSFFPEQEVSVFSVKPTAEQMKRPIAVQNAYAELIEVSFPPLPDITLSQFLLTGVNNIDFLNETGKTIEMFIIVVETGSVYDVTIAPESSYNQSLVRWFNPNTQTIENADQGFPKGGTANFLFIPNGEVLVVVASVWTP